MAAALAEALAKAPEAEGDILVVGHAGYLSFLTLEVLEAAAPAEAAAREAWLLAARGVVLEANVGEACGFEVQASGVRYLLSPEATDFSAARCNDDFTSVAAGAGAGSG
mmetsp:Transcript_67794/g.136158  ORF Transcript_67794/g.136158 Transcript_67794/m.136158 type:complete len:109 (+) Transcript_67794:3-329(+)